MESYKEQHITLGYEETLHEEAQNLLNQHSDLNLDLMGLHDIELLSDDDINDAYDHKISIAVDEERSVLRDDSTHDTDTIELAVQELLEKMESNRSSFVDNYKLAMQDVQELEEELELCNEKIKTLFPYINAIDIDLYNDMENIYNSNEKQLEYLEYQDDLPISELSDLQQEQIIDVLKFRYNNSHYTEYDDIDLHIERDMAGTISDLDYFMTPKQMDALLSNESAYAREMNKGREVEM